MRPLVIALLVVLAAPRPSEAQQSFYSHDSYTQYELLEPGSAQFAITYAVTERRAGSRFILNQTRSGSAGTGISVFDPQTGKPLKFDYMTGAELAADGTPGRLAPAEHYIRAHLARPVPEGAEGRVRILKTYKDEKSYYTDGDDIVFRRSLGIARNGIVLPKGYRLVSSNVASQLFTLPDGRLKVSFEHAHGYPADVTIRARRSPAVAGEAPIEVDRAFDSSKTLYDVRDAARGTITLTHEYLETTPGAQARLKRPVGIGDELVVTDVDSGRALPVSRSGQQAVAELGTPIAGPGQSARLRITGAMAGVKVGTLQGAVSLNLTIAAARAIVLLPDGWDVRSVSVPATVTAQPDGRMAIQIYSGSAGSRHVTIRAAKR